MKSLNKKIIAAALLANCPLSAMAWEWPWNWGSSGEEANVTWDDKKHTQKEEPLASTNTPTADEESTDETASKHNEEKDEATSKATPFDYESLGIKLLPIESPFLVGTPEKILERLVGLYKKSPEKAAGLFASIERANPALAANILDNPEAIDAKLVSHAFAHELRLSLLKKVPSKLIAKVISELPTRVGKSPLMHWGYFSAENPYFTNGKMVLDRALISPEALPLVYIAYLFTQNISDKDMVACQIGEGGAIVGCEYSERVSCIFNILGKLPADRVAEILILDTDKAHFQIGIANRAHCFGQVLAKGLCEEKHDYVLPPETLAEFVNTFASRSDLRPTAAMLLERQLQLHKTDFNAMLKKISHSALEGLIPFLSPAVQGRLPVDLTVAILENAFSLEDNGVLAIGAGDDLDALNDIL